SLAGTSREHASLSQLVTTRCLALSQGLAPTPTEERHLRAELLQSINEWEDSHAELCRTAYLAGFSIEEEYSVSHARMHAVATAFVNQAMAPQAPVDLELLARDLLMQSDAHANANDRLTDRVAAAMSTSEPNSSVIRGASILVACLIVYQIGADSVRHSSQKNRALRELEDRSSRHQRLLATMGHELRTPLASILGNAELLKSGAPGEADDGQCLWTIKQNCNHLLGLIDGFLGQSRAHEHNVDAVLSCVRVAEVVTESAEICRSQAKAKGIELHIELDESAPEWIITDALRLRQILLNLLGNAIRHTDAGQVRIAFDGGSGSADEPVLIRVADTGCGIAPDELERIFEPSYQSPRSKKVGSAGLGLAICRELAASLGGDITVTSRQGVGSEFVVSIPRHLSFVIDNTIPHEASASVDPTPLEGKTIILAEDCPDIQRVVGTHLRHAGATVIVTASGQALVNHFHDTRNRPDLVLVDIHLEDVSGIHATYAIRRLGVHTPIIALSASDTADDRAACRIAGCDAYLTKPIDADTLVSICRTWADAAPQAA
ncbi:MAG: response regulator, partial [Phycisphaerales bacterium]|nr:response regulator [Phycisphaerales bacterium]